MGRTTAWETYMRQAAAQLGRACAETANHMAENEAASVREIRELAGAMKELTALHAALGGNPAAPRSAGTGRSKDGQPGIAFCGGMWYDSAKRNRR